MVGEGAFSWVWVVTRSKAQASDPSRYWALKCMPKRKAVDLKAAPGIARIARARAADRDRDRGPRRRARIKTRVIIISASSLTLAASHSSLEVR